MFANDNGCYFLKGFPLKAFSLKAFSQGEYIAVRSVMVER